MAALEIEQKFIYEMKDIAKRLATYNATFLGQKTFLDTYYDFKDKKLALRNVWLRKRVNTWELKTGNIGKIDPDNLNGLGTTYYVEREGEEAISKELDRYDFFSKAPTFSTKLALVKPLAIIETTRTSYRLNDHTKIDLDQAKLIPTPDLKGKETIEYSIGEIEIMVYDQKNLHDSHNNIVEEEMEKIRGELGITTSQRLLSKLDKYFLEFLPDFYQNYPYHSYYYLLLLII